MNWFPTVVDRIKSQLVERYLAGPATDAGVFVVLWFAGADWDESERYDLNLWIGHLLEGAAGQVPGRGVGDGHRVVLVCCST